ncbi:hypothetical protein DU508_10045 [Pedobacter chinensis]|uniref:Uncharacterized protein n=1 Tax=Pedobacter chinensis TaxID=2282421 RepID=A0A369PXR9_9SPHI|nr:hypothetical protein [Pedobacter chinensis]RDC57481.1 hypothetical protein DU508_10045 [Pedobacter chinensis]
MNNEINNTDGDQFEKQDDQNIEWDKGEVTYGHSVTHSEFKRKNLPSEEHIAKAEEGNDSKIIDDLKNANLSQGEDIGNRNSDEEKGIGGKDL